MNYNFKLRVLNFEFITINYFQFLLFNLFNLNETAPST